MSKSQTLRIALFIHANGNIGIGTASPSMDVTIKQRHNPDPWGVFTNPSGLMIEHSNDEASKIMVSRYGYIVFAFGSGNSIDPDAWARIAPWNGDYYSPSDRRLKKKLENLNPVLHKLVKIRPSYYYLKDDINERRDIGLIAQDVEVFFPEVVVQ
jgi:hypothetical protein